MEILNTINQTPAINSALITGGAGFVGSALVRKLRTAYPTVQFIVVDSLCNGRRDLLPQDDRLIVAQRDIRDADGLTNIVREIRPDVVFHLAALHFIPYCNAHPAECLEVNVVGTENLLEACRLYPPRQIVIASTAAVYPIWDDACSEESPAPGPTDVYGLSKWINEQQLELFARSTETRCAAARISNVYGPRETNPHIVPEIVDQLAAGATELRLGNTAPKRDYIYVEDVAEALIGIAARNTASHRVFNVGTGTEYSVAELVHELSNNAGREVTIITDPDRVRAVDRMHLLADNSRIRREIDWSPRFDIRQGLKALWKYTITKGDNPR